MRYLHSFDFYLKKIVLKRERNYPVFIINSASHKDNKKKSELHVEAQILDNLSAFHQRSDLHFRRIKKSM